MVAGVSHALAAYSPTDVEPFLVTSATVAATDGLPAGAHASFAISCSGASTSPTWMTDGSAPTCSSNQLTIYVTPATKFFEQVDKQGNYCAAPTGCAYTPTTYDKVVSTGAPVRVGGSWTRQNYSSYQFTASYVWNPGTNVQDPPPLPRPSTPQDYNYSHRFVVDATVNESGAALLSGGILWSDKWGIVVGHIPTTVNPLTNTDGYFGNAQVAAIAAAHRDPTTLDPQLSITLEDASNVSNNTFATPLTRYWTQEADGKFHPSNKAEATTCTTAHPCAPGTLPQVRVAGAYGWGDGDWRFLAIYVWRPMPANQPGAYLFNVTSQRPAGARTTDTNVPADYSGSTLSGPGDVNPAGVTINTTWSLAADGFTWQITGDWKATRCVLNDGTSLCSDRGTISGSLSGTWNSSNQQITANAVMDPGTGVFCGVSGAGTFSGHGAPDAPTLNFDGAFTIITARDPTATC
jgi:hypothetical protein